MRYPNPPVEFAHKLLERKRAELFCDKSFSRSNKFFLRSSWKAWPITHTYTYPNIVFYIEVVYNTLLDIILFW